MFFHLSKMQRIRMNCYFFMWQGNLGHWPSHHLFWKNAMLSLAVCCSLFPSDGFCEGQPFIEGLLQLTPTSFTSSHSYNCWWHELWGTGQAAFDSEIWNPALPHLPSRIEIMHTKFLCVFFDSPPQPTYFPWLKPAILCPFFLEH